MDKDTIENILIASNMIKTLGSLYYTNYHGECNNKLGTFVNFVKLPKTICFGIDDILTDKSQRSYMVSAVCSDCKGISVLQI